MGRPVCVVANPRAGRGRFEHHGQPTVTLLRLLGSLEEGALEPKLLWTRHPGEATLLAERARSSKAEVLFSLGGDGTHREAAAGLIGGTLPLAPLPGGTANVLPRALAIPTDPIKAAARYAACCRHSEALPLRAMDVGYLGEHPFLMMASLGLDARALRRVNPRWKRRFGRLAVVWAGLRELARRQETLEIRLGETEQRPRRVAFACFANIALYGGGFRLAPGADSGDGELDVVVIESTRRTALLGFAVRVWARTLIPPRHPSPAASCLRVAAAEVRATKAGSTGGLDAQVDGDPIRVESPTQVTLSKGALPLLSPFS